MKNLFAQRPAPGRAAEVKGWTADGLRLSEADLVTVAQLTCHEPECPPVETVITVQAGNNKRRVWRIPKPLAEVEQFDVVLALGR